MTVETTISKAGPYAGAGTVGPFPVPFRFLDATHLQVTRTDASGVNTVLALGPDYSVSGVGNLTGSVTLTSPLASGFKLTVLRNVPATQEADYVQNDAFPAESHEQALDKLTMLAQQQAELVGRALVVPETDVSVSLTLPSASSRARRYLSFDADGRPVSTTFDIDAVQEASQAAQDAAAAASVSENNAATSAANAAASAEFAREQSDFVKDQVAATTPTVVRFSGDGVETTFPLPSVPGAEENTLVYISGAYQQKNTYDIPAGTSSLVFSEAPPLGTENIEVVIAPSVMLSISDAQDMSFVGPDGIKRNVGYYLRDAVSRVSIPFQDYSSAQGAATKFPEGQRVEVESDETRDDRRTLYAVNAGALVFVDYVPDAIRMQSYVALRSYTGKALAVDITSPGLAGRFNCLGVVPGVVEDGGTRIIDAMGRLWERAYTGAVDVKWFGAKGNGVTDDRPAIQLALDAAEVIIFSPGKYWVAQSTLDTATDWRHHFVVPGFRTLYFQGAEILTSTTWDTRAVLFLVRGSLVEFNDIRTRDLNTATASNVIVPIGCGSTYDSQYPDTVYTDLYVNGGVMLNSWLSVSVQFSGTDGGNKGFRRVRVNNCESIAREGNTSSGNFNFRCDNVLWRIQDVQMSNCRGYNGATASTFNFVGVDGFSHSNCTSYYNKYAGTELENGCQDGTISNFRSVDDLWAVWIDDSRRITVNGLNHKTISETVVSPLLGTFPRYREAVKITRQGFVGYTDWKTEGIEINGVVSEFGRVVIGTFGSTPAGEFGHISINGLQLFGDGVARSSGVTAVLVGGTCPDFTLTRAFVRGAPSRSIELNVPAGGKHTLKNVRTETAAGESSTGLLAVGAGRLSVDDVAVHTENLTVSSLDAIDYRVGGVLQPMRMGGQRVYFGATGAPEGALTGGPGSLALRSDAGGLYVKETGTGNTGWVRK